MEGPRPDQPGSTPRWRPRRSFWWTLIALLIVNWLVSSLFLRPAQPTELPYTLFRAQVVAGNVSSVNATEDAITGKFRTSVRYPSGDKGKAGTPGWLDITELSALTGRASPKTACSSCWPARTSR